MTQVCPDFKILAPRLYFMQKHLDDISISPEAKSMLKRSITATKEYIVESIMHEFEEGEDIA